MKAGLIAAGLGERLQAGGIDTPKPLVRVAGKALVDHVLDAVAAAGIDEVACIFNAEPPADAVEAHCLSRGRRAAPDHRPPHDAELDGESVHAGAAARRRSLPAAHRRRGLRARRAARLPRRRGAPRRRRRRARGDRLHRRREAAACRARRRRPRHRDRRRRRPGSAWSPPGFYVFAPARLRRDRRRPRRRASPRCASSSPTCCARGYRIAGAPMGKTLDVDRPQDIAAAEAFVRGGFAS